jgi:HlyD family secretion protein
MTGLDDEAYTEIVQGSLKASDQIITAEQRDTANARSAVPRPRL